MRLRFSLGIVTAWILNYDSVQALDPSSSSSSVYLLPSDSSFTSPRSISNSQFASVLAHHLKVADHKLGHFVGKDSKLWNWLPKSDHKDAKHKVAQLFQDQDDEINLVFHVKGAEAINGQYSSLRLAIVYRTSNQDGRDALESQKREIVR